MTRNFRFNGNPQKIRHLYVNHELDNISVIKFEFAAETDVKSNFVLQTHTPEKFVSAHNNNNYDLLATGFCGFGNRFELSRW